MRKMSAAYLVAACIIASPTNALANDLPDVAGGVQVRAGWFEVVWQVEPTAPATSAITVERDSIIAQTRLLPTKLLVPEADVYDERGDLLLPKGAELALAYADGIVGCVINGWSVNRRTGIRFGAMNRNTCLMDSDKDGRFDHQFTYSAVLLTLGATGTMRSISPIAPVAFREVSANLSQDSPNLYLIATDSFNSAVLCPGWNPKPSPRGFCLKGSIGISRKQLPFSFTVLGARFTLESVAQNVAHFTQESGFAAQPLRIKNYFPQIF